jgi:hypothetical protein
MLTMGIKTFVEGSGRAGSGHGFNRASIPWFLSCRAVDGLCGRGAPSARTQGPRPGRLHHIFDGAGFSPRGNGANR